MANQKHARILKDGVNIWNRWRKQHPEIKPNLKGIDLGIVGTDLSEEKLKLIGLDNDDIKVIKLSREGLKGINLSDADLRRTNLWKINLSYADLRNANLQGAYLRDTNMFRANLKGANLSECLLRSTILNSACLDETDFSASEIGYTKFRYVDLSTAKGLDKCQHPCPIINVTTILLSKGCIPEAFLRSASVPESLISYSKSLPLAIQQSGEANNTSILKQAPIKIFYCYARKDDGLRGRLEQHLAPLKYEGLIVEWYDRKISAGKDYQQEILLHIDTSDILLALITPDFMSSNYCQGIELRRALDKHTFGELRVIPVILRPVDWLNTPLGRLQALPKDGKPVTKWESVDDALLDVTQDIRKVVEELQESKTKFAPEISVLDENKGFELLSLGSNARNDNYYWEALEAFKRAVHFNPYNTDAWSGMAEVLFSLRKYQDAFIVCERALHIPTETPRYWATINIKADALEGLGRHEEAKNIREEGSRMASERKKANEFWLSTQSFD